MIGQPQQSCARVSDWPISIHNWVYIFPSVEFSIYVPTFYSSEECQLKSVSNMFQNVCFLQSNTIKFYKFERDRVSIIYAKKEIN